MSLVGRVNTVFHLGLSAAQLFDNGWCHRRDIVTWALFPGYGFYQAAMDEDIMM